jgi:hypothetical protein
MREGFGPTMNTPGHSGWTSRPGSTSTGCGATASSAAREALNKSEFGAFLLFDFYNIRYVSQTWIGGAFGDKMTRYCLLTRDHEPMCGTSAVSRAPPPAVRSVAGTGELPRGMLGLRGAIAPRAGLIASAVKEIVSMLPTTRCWASRSGSTSSNCRSWLRAAERRGGRARRATDHARRAPDQVRDEIMLLTQAAAMVDGVYQDIFEALKPGVRENEIVALANKRLYEMGSDQVEAINAVSGERCNPTRTTSPTGSSVRGSRPSSTSSTPSTDTGRATTARSRWAVRRGPSVTPTPRPANGWTRPSIWCAPASAPTTSPGVARGHRLRVRERDGGLRACSSATGWASGFTNVR